MFSEKRGPVGNSFYFLLQNNMLANLYWFYNVTDHSEGKPQRNYIEKILISVVRECIKKLYSHEWFSFFKIRGN